MQNLGEIPNKCYLCNEPFTVDSTKEVEIAELKGNYYHKKCFLKELPDGDLQFLLVVSPKSIGDAISHTPLVKEFKRLYPFAKLDVLTVFPDLFKWNDNVRNVIPWQDNANDSIYKKYHVKASPFNTKNPNAPLHMLNHSVDFVSYGMFRKTLKPEHKDYEVYYTYVDINNMEATCKRYGAKIGRDKMILVHPHKAFWPTRTWGKHNWQEIVTRLKNEYPDFKIVCIGGNRSDTYLTESAMDNRVELEGCVDLYNKLSLLETIALMDKAELLITLDTGALHLAGASKIKIACAFTVVNSQYRLPYRNGVFAKDCYWIDANCEDNIYNHQFITEVTNITTCPKGYDPIKCLPKVDKFWDKIKEAMEG